MLSVYYASLGSEFEVCGAPSVFMPPQINLLPLAEALRRLSTSPTRLREAIWLLVRASAAKGMGGDPIRPLPAELDVYLSNDQRDELEGLRRDYRAGSSVFAAALVACRDGDWDLVRDLARILKDNAEDRDISQAIAPLFGNRTAWELLTHWEENMPAQASGELLSLESEIGMNLYEFVIQFADAAAFQVFSRLHALGGAPVVTGKTPTVLPVTSVISQNTRTLVTTATVTTIVTGDFAELRAFTDPLAWAVSSDVVKSVKYVADPFPGPKTPPVTPPEIGRGFEGAKLLEEEAAFAWGQDDDQRAAFHNILRVEQVVTDADVRKIDIDFSLSRSIGSTVLWDQRSGGLLANQGYLKVRALGNRSWRVTTRKQIKFSDRTPEAAARGMTDFGQLLNYFAPTAISWWVESQTYSMGDRPADEVRSRATVPTMSTTGGTS